MTRDSVIIVPLFVSAYLLDYKLYVVQDEINVWLILDPMTQRLHLKWTKHFFLFINSHVRVNNRSLILKWMFCRDYLNHRVRRSCGRG